MSATSSVEAQSGAKVQRSPIEPHTLEIPAILSALIDQLVEREQARTGARADVARREVEALVLREGIAAAQREAGA